MLGGDPKNSTFLLFTKIFFGLVLLLLLPYLTYFGFKKLRDAIQSDSWLETKVTILNSEVVAEGVTLRTRFRPKLKYAYEVDGKPYTGDRLRFQISQARTSEQAASTLEKYRVGSEHVGYYNPKNHAESVLQKGATREEYYLPIVVLISFLGLGIYSVNSNWRAYRKKRLLASQSAVESVED